MNNNKVNNDEASYYLSFTQTSKFYINSYY